MGLLAIAKAIWGPPKDWAWHPLWPLKKEMIRKVGGRWESRAPTEQDTEDFKSADGW